MNFLQMLIRLVEEDNARRSNQTLSLNYEGR
jgi:hypothetical protein